MARVLAALCLDRHDRLAHGQRAISGVARPGVGVHLDDDAFAAVPADTLAALAADKALLTKVLTYHVVPGKVMAADIAAGDVATVAGPTVKLTITDGKVMVNDATVVTADVAASNGVIHVIDKVLLPPA